MEGRHTSDNIADYLAMATTRFQAILFFCSITPVQVKQGVAVTDWAANMQLGVRKAALSDWVGCFSHALHRCVLSGLSKVPQLGNIKRIVAHFHHSGPAIQNLHAQQCAADKPERKLVQANDTRWTSSFGMLESFLDNWLPIANCLILEPVE